MEVGWSLRWRVEGGRERSDWRGIFLIFLLNFCFIFWGNVGGLGSMGLYICMDENGDYGSVVVVVVGNRCPRIGG